MKNAVLRGMPYVGNPHVRHGEGKVASGSSSDGSMLFPNGALRGLGVLAAALTFAFTASASPSPSPYVTTPGWIRTQTRFLNSQSTSVTVEIWVRPMVTKFSNGSVGYAHHLIEQYSAGLLGRQNFTLVGVDDTHLRIRNFMGGLNAISSEDMVSDVEGAKVNGGLLEKGVWSHVAWVCDGDTWRFYINGELNNEQSGHNVANHLDENGPDGFVIGNSRTTNPNGSCDAYLAEARLWKRARTSAEIKAWYNRRISEAWNEPDLIGYWPMAEGQNVVEANGGFRNYVISSAVNNPSGTPYLCNYAEYSGLSNVRFPECDIPVPVTGELNGDGWALQGHASSLQRTVVDTQIYDAPHNFTMMGWFLRTENGTADRPECYFGRSGDGNGRMLLREWDGALRFWMGGGISGKTNEELVVTLPAAANPWRWHHLACVRRDKEVGIYINGELVKSGGLFTMDLLSTRPLYVGGFEAGGSRGNFRGLIKDVSFLGKALSADKIKTYMTKSPRAAAPALIGYWPMNVTNATTVANLRSGAPNGVLYVPTGEKAQQDYWTGRNLFWTKSAGMPMMSGTVEAPGGVILVR